MNNTITTTDGRRWVVTPTQLYRVTFDQRRKHDIYIREDWCSLPLELTEDERKYDESDYFSGDYGRW